MDNYISRSIFSLCCILLNFLNFNFSDESRDSVCSESLTPSITVLSKVTPTKKVVTRTICQEVDSCVTHTTEENLSDGAINALLLEATAELPENL